MRKDDGEEEGRLCHKVLTYVEYRAVSGVFQSIDPPYPLSTQRVCPPPHSPGGEGSIFWKTPDIGLASYSLSPLRFVPIRHKFQPGGWGIVHPFNNLSYLLGPFRVLRPNLRPVNPNLSPMPVPCHSQTPPPPPSYPIYYIIYLIDISLIPSYFPFQQCCFWIFLEERHLPREGERGGGRDLKKIWVEWCHWDARKIDQKRKCCLHYI